MRNLLPGAPTVRQLRQTDVAAERDGFRMRIGTAPCLERPSGGACDKPRDAETARHAMRRPGPHPRLCCAGWDDRSHPGRDLNSRRDGLLWRHSSNLPRWKGRPKKRNRKNYKLLRLTAIPRHTASMFLSPVSFALRTLHLR